VDSTLSALLLKEAGALVEGATLVMEDTGDGSFSPCGTSATAQLAARAAQQIGIPHRTVLAGERFRTEIMDRSLQMYQSGVTPNPCALCNLHIKFGLLADSAMEWGFDLVATGHYTGISRGAGNEILLARGADPSKDQSYFLFAIGRDRLDRVVFPLSGMLKEQVRELAAQRNLEAANRPDSQDLCFSLDKLLGSRGRRKGEIINQKGHLLGSHNGIWNYTIGQRRGLGVSYHYPLYVVDLDPAANRVIVGPNKSLFLPGLTASWETWYPIAPAAGEFSALVQIRYRAQAVKALVRTIGEPGKGELTVYFETPQRAVTPGQALVIYDESDRLLLGGGWITRGIQPEPEQA